MSDFRLCVFAAVARHLSFTKAGQELFVSQPAVTKHIRELEAQYSQRLLERRGNRVALTEAGRLLQVPAEAVAASAQQLEEQLLGLRDPEEAAGRLRSGTSTTLSQYVLPAWLPAFQARYPQVQLILLAANSERIAEALLRGELDLGFVEGRTKNRDLHYELLLPDELVPVRRATPTKPPTQPLPLAGPALQKRPHGHVVFYRGCPVSQGSVFGGREALRARSRAMGRYLGGVALRYSAHRLTCSRMRQTCQSARAYAFLNSYCPLSLPDRLALQRPRLANERTLLTYVRTTLVLVGFILALI